ncbi:MAG: hypothetical protein R3F61_25240 [Myxococcota bacterium]
MLFAWLLPGFAAPPEPVPAPPSAQEAPKASVGTAWRSSSWCLEAWDDGRIVLSDRDVDRPKIAIHGRLVERRVEGSVETFRFTVERIHRSRWVSRCRKEVLGEEDLPTHEMGGQAFTPGETVEVRLERTDAPGLRLCLVYACAVVEPEPLVPADPPDPSAIPGVEGP